MRYNFWITNSIWLILLIISCSEKKTTVGMRGFIDSFQIENYHVKVYGNTEYKAEDWIYRFVCESPSGNQRLFELRTQIIESRQFYLSERISGKWKAIIHFPARPSYQVVKTKLVNYLSYSEN